MVSDDWGDRWLVVFLYDFITIFDFVSIYYFTTVSAYNANTKELQWISHLPDGSHHRKRREHAIDHVEVGVFPFNGV